MENKTNSGEMDPEGSKWIWGIFYFNPADKRLFPPKRVQGMGWTVNFANPYSIGLLVLIVVVLQFMPAIIRAIAGH